MNIRHLELTSFRTVENLDLSIDQDFIVLVGPNASGKTTILESIYYASVLQAFPPSKTWELIRFDRNFFRIKLTAHKDKFEYYYGRKDEKRYERSQSINGVRKKTSEIFGVLPVVTFLPQDLNILQLSPGLRREYLDEILLQTNPEYETALAEYAKVLVQRNELLSRIRQEQAKASELDFWDEKLAGTASIITGARRTLCEFLNINLSRTYQELIGQSLDCQIRYSAALDTTEQAAMIEAYRQSRKRDVASERTSIGPHRDDWKIFDQQQRDLSHFLSRGEQRSLILCLKKLETLQLRQALSKDPVILLDELFAELDAGRKKTIVENLPAASQKFLTTTDLGEVPQNILQQAQVIELVCS